MILQVVPNNPIHAFLYWIIQEKPSNLGKYPWETSTMMSAIPGLQWPTGNVIKCHQSLRCCPGHLRITSGIHWVYVCGHMCKLNDCTTISPDDVSKLSHQCHHEPAAASWIHPIGFTAKSLFKAST